MAKIRKENAMDLSRKIYEEEKKLGAEKVRNRLSEWLDEYDSVVQFKPYDISVEKDLEDILNKYEELNIVLYDGELGGGGFGGLPPAQFMTWLELFIVIAIFKIGEGFFEKIGADLADLAKRLFKIKKRQNKRLEPIAIVFKNLPAETWYILHNNLNEEEFAEAFSKIYKHYQSLSEKIEKSDWKCVNLIYDTARQKWVIDSFV